MEVLVVPEKTSRPKSLKIKMPSELQPIKVGNDTCAHLKKDDYIPKYSSVLLNDGDMFWQMYCEVIPSSRKHHRMHLHTSRWYNLLHTQAMWYSLMLPRLQTNLYSILLYSIL